MGTTNQLTAPRDQWQQNFATVQGQLGQLSLNTQMILDQQRRTQTSPNGYFIEQSWSTSAELATNQRHPDFIQPFVSRHGHTFAQDPLIGVQLPSAPAAWPQKDFSHALLPMSAVGLERETTNLQHLERATQCTRSRLMKNLNTSKSCTCRKRHLKKQVVQLPFVVSRNEIHFHDPSCPLWIAWSRDITLSFGMILCSSVLGLKLRLFMELLVGSGTFSIMPTLAIRRIVTVDSSPAFKLIDKIIFCHQADGSGFTCSAELTKIFQTRQASPHERLGDGKTLLHVSF